MKISDIWELARRSFQGPLYAGFSSGSEPLGQGVQRRVIHRNTPFARHGGGLFIRVGGGDGEGQFVFQGQAQLLMAGQSPMFAYRTTPVPVARILAVEHFEFNDAHTGAQVHRAGAPMHQFPSAGQCQDASAEGGAVEESENARDSPAAIAYSITRKLPVSDRLTLVNPDSGHNGSSGPAGCNEGIPIHVRVAH